MPDSNTPGSGKFTLIVSDDENPRITLKAGMKLDVVSVKLADAALEMNQPIAARLCGGTSTCIALIETGDPTDNG